MAELTSVSEIIETLGGAKAVAAMFRCTPTAIGNWRAANKMPADTFLAIGAALDEAGCSASLDLWSFRDIRPFVGAPAGAGAPK